MQCNVSVEGIVHDSSKACKHEKKRSECHTSREHLTAGNVENGC